MPLGTCLKGQKGAGNQMPSRRALGRAYPRWLG